MSELAEPIALRRAEEGILSRFISVRVQVDWQLAAYAALMLVAASMRFWDLGARALHHDESLHAWTAWKLYDGQGYEHQPWMHGPFQFFATAFNFFLFGDSDYATRIVPAIFGSALVALPFFLRHRLGTIGALLTAAAIAVSPTLLYFSRFARNDIYVAFFTLGLVVCLWRYLDERKPRYLYLAALLLGLAFATNESIFINVTVLIAFLNIWMAIHFWGQIRDHNKLEPLSSASILLLLSLSAWAVAALWPFTKRWRSQLGLKDWHPAADFLILLGTLTLPQFAAAIQVPLGLLGIDNADLARSVGHGVTRENLLGFFTIAALVSATAAIGLRWKLRVWPAGAAAFYIPYILLYTSFFTNAPDGVTRDIFNLDGFYSGHWGSLNYWLDQQNVARGEQPWFYYLMLLPVYEFLPLTFAAPGLFYYAVRGDAFRRFLVFWFPATVFGYSVAGEKMPWLSVYTTLPVVLLGACFLGEVLTSRPMQNAVRPLEAYARPLAAAVLGLAIVALGLFGPAGPWIGLRILLMLLASAGILLLLLPVNLQPLVAPKPKGRRRRQQQPPPALMSLSRVAVLGSSVLAGGLLAITLFVGVRLTYQLGDVPRELLVYTQTSPRVPDVVDRINAAARTSGLEEDLPLAIEGGLEPWVWYLRDYKAVRENTAFTTIAGRQPPPDAVVVVLASNEAAMQPYLDQYAPPFRFPLRWWFPEFDTYKTLPTANVYRGINLDSVPRFAADFIGSLFRASSWENWWDYFRDRKPRPAQGGPEDSLGRLDLVAYFPKKYGIEAPVVAPPSPTPPQQPPAATATVPPPSLPALQQLPVNLVLGRPGSEPGAFSQPAGLTIDSQGNLYVTEVANNRIQKFGPEGEILAQLGRKGSGDGEFNEPWGIAVDPQGNVYVADTFNHRIQKFDANLQFVLAWGKPASSLDSPEPDAFWGPRDVAVAPDGNIWVTDGGTNRVVKYDPSGRFIQAFGGVGNTPGKFKEPTAIEIAPAGDIFVADSANRRVQRFDASFGLLAEYPVPGWLFVDSLVKPYIALLPDGGLIVSDPTQNKLLRLDAGGVPVATLDAQDAPLALPRGVAFDSRGYVYVAEGQLHQVRRLLLQTP